MRKGITPPRGISRRAALAGGAAGAAVLIGAHAEAQQTSQQGPRVWLDLDQKQLDDAYDQAKYGRVPRGGVGAVGK
jgi:arylformamidase